MFSFQLKKVLFKDLHFVSIHIFSKLPLMIFPNIISVE
jgi:hypothetical protein